MSAPIDSNLMAPLAVFVASLLGSSHCAGMCGGLVLFIGQNKLNLVVYHAGRLLGYLTVGALAGELGKSVLQAKEMQGVAIAASALLGAVFVATGVRLVWPEIRKRVAPRSGASFYRPFAKLNRMWSGAFHRLALVLKKRSHTWHGALAFGVSTALLPCGWLYTFVLAAVATQSALLGAATLFAFWLGTVPALSAAPWVLRSVLKPISGSFPIVSGLLLVAVGLYSWSGRSLQVIGNLGNSEPPGETINTNQPSCHGHHSGNSDGEP
ncbi:MAG TPA: sulfite exporter TauE/SafE family protein [Oligoflexia bacterium]|nr:sulfite exporter TauE/SafE family protein [Oligoflexia bacterium]